VRLEERQERLELAEALLQNHPVTDGGQMQT
jgi:hypothetical protein